MLQLLRDSGIPIKSTATQEDKNQLLEAIAKVDLENVRSIFARCRGLKKIEILERTIRGLNLASSVEITDSFFQRVKNISEQKIPDINFFKCPVPLSPKITLTFETDEHVQKMVQFIVSQTSLNLLQYTALLPWKTGRDQIMNYLVTQQKMDLNEGSIPPLVCCAFFDNYPMATYLLRNFPQLQLDQFPYGKNGGYGVNILHIIIRGELERELKTQILEELIEKNPSLLTQFDGTKSFTPLYYAISFNLLTEKIGELSVPVAEKYGLWNQDGGSLITPLTLALQSLFFADISKREAELKSIEIALRYGAWPNEKMEEYEKEYVSPLYMAVTSLNRDELSWFIDQRRWNLEARSPEASPLHRLVLFYLKQIDGQRGADAPIALEVNTGKEIESKIELLVHRGARLIEETPFVVALESGLRLNANYRTPAELAISFGLCSLTRLLLNDSVKAYLTPDLILARLLHLPESLFVKTTEHNSVVMHNLAHRKNREENRDLYNFILGEYQTQITLQHKLHLTIIFETPLVLQEFFNSNPEIDINSQTSFGITPLFTAVLMRDPLMIQELLKFPQIDMNQEVSFDENWSRITQSTLENGQQALHRWTPYYLANRLQEYNLARFIHDAPGLDPKKYNQVNRAFLELIHPSKSDRDGNTPFISSKIIFPLDYSSKDIYNVYTFFMFHPTIDFDGAWFEKINYYHQKELEIEDAKKKKNSNSHVIIMLSHSLTFAKLGKVDQVHGIFSKFSFSELAGINMFSKSLLKLTEGFEEYKNQLNRDAQNKEETMKKIIRVNRFLENLIRAKVSEKNWDDFRKSFWLPLKGAEIFGLTVLVCDDYLRLKPANQITDPDQLKMIRYFQILTKLPMELQMVLSNLTCGYRNEVVLSFRVEMAIKKGLCLNQWERA